jgi:hypothetical protein
LTALKNIAKSDGMKFILTFTLCLCVILLLCNKQTRAQAVPEKPPIVDFFPSDTYGNISIGDEKARLDNLAGSLRKEPEQMAYIFVYAGQRPCPGEAQAKIAFVKNHFVKTLGIEPDRVMVQDGGYRDELTVELRLWLRNSEFGTPSATPTIDPSEVRIKRNCEPISRRRRVQRHRRKQ